MKRAKKIGVIILGMLAIGYLLASGLSSAPKDMETAKGSSPSPSYQYHLQIFHAF